MNSQRPASMQKRLLLGSLAVTGSGLAAFLIAMVWIIASLSSRHRQEVVDGIRKALIAKGNILVSNNAQAMSRMVEDNSVLSVADLVASTVRDDSDLVFGIFMDADRQAWVRADSANREGRISGRMILEDSASLWAAGLSEKSCRLLHRAGGDVYEFAAPVLVDGKIGGTIRYGLSTGGMRAAMEKAAASSRHALLLILAVIGLLACAAIGLAFPATQWLARRLTQPLRELQSAAKAISGGDYARPVVISSGGDEVGALAADFEAMRVVVRNYTERLQAMVAEKVREIRDILDHIGQGLFTVGLEGKINPDYARSTNAILQVEDASRTSLQSLFRLNEEEFGRWMEWLNVLRLKYGQMSWERLVRLSPVRELRLQGDTGETRTIIISYQPMLDEEGRLNKLMVLALDVTEARRAEAAMSREREAHEQEVRAILGIVRHAKSLPDFFQDFEKSLLEIEAACETLSRPDASAEKRERKAFLAREIHTLKGTSATYGFVKIGETCREAELVLAKLPVNPDSHGGEFSGALSEHIGSLRKAFTEVRALASRLSGNADDLSVPVPSRRLKEVRDLCDDLEKQSHAAMDAAWSALIRACRGLDAVRVDLLAEKYAGLVERICNQRKKGAVFRAGPADLELAPAQAAALDAPLNHLIRNAVDHGIEGKEERARSGKRPEGLVELALAREGEDLVVALSDDGRGVDAEKLAEKAVAMGLLKPEEKATMSFDEKAQLIFASGLSSRDGSDDISGMGQGMAAVAAWVSAKGGRLSFTSKPGLGTRLEMRLPPGFETRQR